MSNFSIENISNDIHSPITRKYFEEVISSYQNQNYRSAVVMLWSVAVCDLVYKLDHLVNLYNDAAAKQILDDMTATQDATPTSSAWEITLIEEVFKKTRLLDAAELENLRALQKQRHLSAHPILNRDRELHSPNKDTTRALLRNTLEGLLIKPPFYTNKILDQLLTDLSETAETLNTPQKVNQYLENKYFRRLKPDAQMALFKIFWKFTFRLDNEECNKHRKLNFRVLECISARQRGLIPTALQNDQDFYGNVAPSGDALTLLIYFLANNHELYQHLSQEARIKINHQIENDPSCKVLGWFIKPDLDTHYNDLVSWMTGNDFIAFDPELWRIALDFEDSEEWKKKWCGLMVNHYGTSSNFDTADSRFQNTILPNLKLFDTEVMHLLLKCIEKNDQTYYRSRANSDHKKIVEQITLLDPKFDYSEYPHISRLI